MVSRFIIAQSWPSINTETKWFFFSNQAEVIYGCGILEAPLEKSTKILS